MIRILFTIFMISNVVSAAEPTLKVESPVPPQYTQERVVNFTWSLKNDHNTFLKDIDFYVYAPVGKTAFQFCQSIKADRKFTLIKDQYHNQIMRFSLSRIAPYQRITIRISALLKMSQKSQPLGLLSLDFLKSTRYIQSTNKAIRQVSMKSHKSTANSSYQWIVKNLKKTQYQSKDQGALEALINKKGDCSEFAYLFAALNRATKIPTQYISGFYCAENTTLKANNYHNANFFYQNENWHFADTHQKNYKKNHDQFVVFTIHGGKSEKIMQQNHRFLLKGKAVKNLKILMK